jgi:hypothetical protein
MTTTQILDDRYGRSSSRRTTRFWVVFATIGIALAIAAAGWYAFATPASSIDATTTGFELADGSATVSFQVAAPAGSALACVLEAQDEEHGIVGWKVVEYPPADAHSQAFRETIPVTAEATTGLVNSCWVP